MCADANALSSSSCTSPTTGLKFSHVSVSPCIFFKNIGCPKYVSPSLQEEEKAFDYLLFRKMVSHASYVFWIFTKVHSEHMNLILFSTSRNIFIFVVMDKCVCFSVILGIQVWHFQFKHFRQIIVFEVFSLIGWERFWILVHCFCCYRELIM